MTSFRDLSARVLGLFGIGHIRLVKDDGEQQLVQLELKKGGPDDLNEVIDDLPRIGHYGIYYRPPDGAEALAVFLGARRSSGIVFATGFRETRVKNLLPGEFEIAFPDQNLSIKLCADGKIRSQGDWLHTGSFSATGDILDHSADNTATMKIQRDAYNEHNHVDPQGGVTDPPNPTIP